MVTPQPLKFIYPKENALRQRLLAHLRARQGDELAVLVWTGYIWALGEKALLAQSACKHLEDLMPNIALLEICEIAGGPDVFEEVPDLRQESLDIMRADEQARAGRDWLAELDAAETHPWEKPWGEVRPIDVEDLAGRITEHLAARPGNTRVGPLWHGFVVALNEWGLVTDEETVALRRLLPARGLIEACEIRHGPDHWAAHPQRRDEILALIRAEGI